ncbi:hypothetical protein HPP92_018928 [Vanilla planifolia]|uniref:Uncharacterized protein n=1 Tax=Vanilla planifolia TaxID=51239 RepID=A0A835UMV3_VANPL|nr:hypothetical protein HPP92_018928 [Vanilla planifolia]
MNETLEFTPTWVVAVVCTVIVVISLFVEQFIHYLGQSPYKVDIPKLEMVDEVIGQEDIILIQMEWE